MSSSAFLSRAKPIALSTIGASGLVGAGVLTYALWEAQSYRLREIEVPALRNGADPFRILHLSDLHMTPGQHKKQDWVRALAALEPDLVIATGDFFSHQEALDSVISTLAPLLEFPGLFVLGSNDYFSPRPINPLRYFGGPRPIKRHEPDLPWQDLVSTLTACGWIDLDNRRDELRVDHRLLDVRGTDDPHIYRDDYSEVAGPFNPKADLRIAVTHAPYLRVLDAMAADRPDLIVAGHTHGGQICLPGYGALVTNCDLDRARAKGLSDHHGTPMHVSAGLGTNRYSQVRIACPPEATLLTLTPAHPRTTAVEGG